MQRLLVRGLVAGATLGGVLFVGASPGGAGVPPAINAEISADVVAPGEDVTVSSIDPCETSVDPDSETDVIWGVYAEEGDSLADGVTPTDEDGQWEFTFAAPDEPGDYTVYMTCDPGFVYYPLEFTVVETSPTTAPPATAPPATTPTVPTAPPATPVTAEPSFTG